MIFAAKKPNPELDKLMAQIRNAPPMTDAEIYTRTLCRSLLPRRGWCMAR